MYALVGGPQFNMIHRMFYLRTALNVLVASDVLPKRLEISVAQWEALAGIRDVLKPISIVQKLLEGEKYVTASWLPILIHTCRKGLERGCNHQSATVRTMSKMLKDNYKVRWGKETDQWYNPNIERGAGNRQIGIHPCFLIASFLDPRFKRFLGVNIDDFSKVRIEDKVLKMMIDTATNPDGRPPEIVVPAAAAAIAASQASTILTEDDADPLAIFAQLNTEHNQNHQNDAVTYESSIGEACRNEIEKYKRHELLVPVSTGNPLLWWKRNSILYPNLAALARKYLAIQATSASSERIFSRASLIISNLRRRLLKWYDELCDTSKLNSDDENN